MSAADQHPFVVWFVEQHGGEADTPLGNFAREFAPLFPAVGDRATLRRTLNHNMARKDPWKDIWNRACFDEAYEAWEGSL